MSYRTGAALAAVVLLIAGCSDPKAVSKPNFQAALQGWFDEHPECVNIGTIPATIRINTQIKPWNQAAYEALAAAGLLSAEKRHVEEKSIMGKPMGYDALVYSPTKDGASVIREAKGLLGGGSDLCFARRKVLEVTSYTEPGDMMGIRATQTSYRYRLEDIAPWAQTPALREALPRLAKALEKTEGEDKAALVLTSEGWRHEHSLRK